MIGGTDLRPHQVVLAVTTAAIGGVTALLGELRDEYGFTDAETGMVAAAGFFAAFVTQVGLAPLADRGGARTMTVIGLTTAAVALAGTAVATGLVAWIAARALLGVGAGLVLPGVRRAATVLDPTRVGENLGRLAIGEVVGFLVGPVLAAALVEAMGIRTPFIVFAVGMALFLPLMARLPTDPPAIVTTGSGAGRRGSLDLLRRRRVVGCLALIAANFVLIGSIDLVVPLAFADQGASPLLTAVAFTLLSVPVAVLGPRGGRLADRTGPARSAVAGISAGALLVVGFALTPGAELLVLLLAFGIIEGFSFIAAQVAVSRSVPRDRQAAVLGLMGAAELGVAGLAALGAAAVYASTGAATTWLVASAVGLITVLIAGGLISGTRPAPLVPPQ